MEFWSFLLLVILILAGAMFYHRLQRIEREIRAELQEKDVADEQPSQDEDLLVEEQPETPSPATNLATEKPAGIESQILQSIQADPGVVQTELYKRFPDHSRKALQQQLRKLDQANKISRKKSKGTYRLFSA